LYEWQMRAGLVLALTLLACAPSGTAGAAPSAPPAPIASMANPTREPASLSVFAWEREIIDALRGGGVQIGLIGGSKMETFLGDRRDARVFIKPASGVGGAEVLFLTTPLHELRMCSATSAPGFTRWTVVVDGKSLPGMEGSMTAYPLVGPRFFVVAWDAESATALSNGLGLTAPPC
jgi:hypothetical protein